MQIKDEPQIGKPAVAQSKVEEIKDEEAAADDAEGAGASELNEV